jgi:hypothetical protein
VWRERSIESLASWSAQGDLFKGLDGKVRSSSRCFTLRKNICSPSTNRGMKEAQIQALECSSNPRYTKAVQRWY